MSDRADNTNRTTGPNGGQAAAVAYASRIRLLIKALLVTNRSGWLIAGFVAALFIGGMLDFLFRSPNWLRAAGLLGVTVMVVSLLYRRLLPALRFRPSVEDIALRLATPSSQFGIPAASGFEQAGGSGAGIGITGKLAALAGELIGSTGVGTLNGSGLIRWQPAARAAGTLALACLLVVSMFAYQPGLAWIGTRRMLLPWSDAAWPRRYHVEAIGTATVAPLGQAIVLQAGLLNAPGKLEQTDVAANITVVVDGKARPMRTVMLTPQDRRKVVGYTGELGEHATAEALVFERLLEPGALDLQTVPGQAPLEAATLRYSLTAGDHTTPEQTLKLVRPPVVTALIVRTVPPAYARQALAASSIDGLTAGATPSTPQKREFANPSGTVIVPGVMEGSDVAIDITLSRALVLPNDIAATLGPQVAELVASGKATLVTSGEAVASGAASSITGGVTMSKTWQLGLSLRESLAMPIRLVDADGLKTAEDVGLRLDMKPDRLPEPVVTLPASDQIVTPQATVDVAVEARDDQGLTAVLARAQRAVRARGSMGAEPEPAFAPVVLTQAEISTPVLTSKLTTTVVPGKLGAVPGDEVLLTAIAQDNFELEGKRHEAVTSQPRRLRIVSAEQLAEKLIADLSAVRRGIIASTEKQDALTKAASKASAQLAQAATVAEAVQTREGADAAADQFVANKAARESLQKTARDQAELARQLDRLGDQAAQAASASRQNKLDPAAAEQAANKAAEALQRATEASAKASADAEAAAKAAEQAEQAGQAAESASGADAKAQAKAAAAQAAAQAVSSSQKAQAEQKQTEKALSEAANALDRGQDAWAARRMLSELADQQKAVRDATKQAGQSTAGKQAEQLSNQERSALQQAAEQQEELARRAAELEQKLQQQADALKERDPASAETLQDAARRARQADLADQMRKAAEQTRNNQAGQAQEGQQKAENTLRSMLEQLDQAKANRDAVLKRQLDSLMQSIDTLIAQQELELKRLADAAASGRFEGLDQSMIRLHAGTLSVLDKAQGDGGSKKAAELLKAAADAQVSAIENLRAKPMLPDEARQNETQSRKLLQEAKAAAEEAKDEAAAREASERRRMLQAAYESILEDQRAITADTLPLVGKAADRRNRQTAGGLVVRQDLVAPRLDDLRDKLAELAESGVFQLAHDRIKSAAATASGLLKSGKWANQLAGRHAAVERTLQALIDALKEKNENDKDFRENEQGDQAGQQGGGQGQKEPLLPPVTELEILKGMQREAMIATREAAEVGDADAAKLAATEAASIQKTLTERARDIVEKLSKLQGQ